MTEAAAPGVIAEIRRLLSNNRNAAPTNGSAATGSGR